MSPVSRKRQKRHASKRPDRAPRSPQDAVYLVLEKALRWTLRTEDPLDAESVVSDLLGSMRGADGVDPGVPAERLDEFIDELAARVAPEATAALVALAHLAPAEPSRELAQRRLRELSHRRAPMPAWAEAIGAWFPRGAMVLADVFGDQANVILEFAGVGRSHALVVLVDFSHLGAWCKDLFVADDLDELRTAMAHEAMTSTGLMRFIPLDATAARFLAVRALEATDITFELDLGDSFDETHALALARLRLLAVSAEGVSAAADDAAVGEALRSAGLPVPSSLEDPVVVEPQERDALVQRFLDSSHAAALVGVAQSSVEYLARLLVDYGCDYDDGRALRVSPMKLTDVLLGWMPSKVTLDAADRDAVPAVIAAWVEFTVGLSQLPPAAVRELRAALADLTADFATEYDNPENFGPARALLDGIGEFSSLKELERLVSGRVAEHNVQLAAGWTYQVRVDVVGAKPPIWRRLELPGSTTLAQLHHVLQASFGWGGGHLHEFTAHRTRYGVPDGVSIRPTVDESLVTLGQILERPGQHLDYQYDFGDSWEHRLVVEQIDHSRYGPVAVCTGGRRAAPFEDSGGVPGYEHLCAALLDPSHPDHAHYVEWVGYELGAVTFDPGAFDKAALNRVLAGILLA